MVVINSAILFNGFYGIINFEKNSQEMETMYNDRSVPLEQLKDLALQAEQLREVMDFFVVEKSVKGRKINISNGKSKKTSYVAAKKMTTENITKDVFENF